MESEKIETLLQKYWKGESSLQEETEIRTFFQKKDIPPHLEKIRPLFQYYHQESAKAPLNEAFDAKLLERLRANGKIHRNAFNWGLLTKIAASLLLIGLSVYYFYLSPRQSGEKAATITYEDPELAFRQTKATLLLISEKLNSGQKYTAEFKKLQEANALFKNYENK